MHTFAQRLSSSAKAINSPRAQAHVPPKPAVRRAVDKEAVQGTADPHVGGLNTPWAAKASPERGFDLRRIPVHPPQTVRLPGLLQRKLEVGTTDDPLEHEADRIADQVMRMPNLMSSVVFQPHLPISAIAGESGRSLEDYERGAKPTAQSVMRTTAENAQEQTPATGGIQQHCTCGGTCSKCQQEGPGHAHPLLRRIATVGNASHGVDAPASVHRVLNSQGLSLDKASRAFMEPRFGREFSHVQVHADAEAAASARVIGARAYTVGSHLVFGQGEDSFSTDRGRMLLAHELAHVVQQEGHRSQIDGSQSLTSGLVQRSPFSGVRPARSTFAQLESRALQIYRDAVTDSLRTKGRDVTEKLLSIKKTELTVAVLEGEKDGQIVTRIAVNDPAYAPFVKRVLHEGELYVEKGSASSVHAEITGARGASVEGIKDALVATSNKGCPHCVQTIDRDFPELAHVNSKIASRGSVELSGRVAKPVTTTTIDLEPGKKYRQRTPPRNISHSETITGEINATDVPTPTTSGDIAPNVIVDDAGLHPAAPTPKPTIEPAGSGVPSLADVPKPNGGFSGGLRAAKGAFVEGVEAAFSPEGIASFIPEALLLIADRVAAREAIRNIRVKFEKEGFAKGVAAGVMQWTKEEVRLNLKHHVTPFRLEHLSDPGGYLTYTFIFQYAEAYEDYAVDVGYQYSSSQTSEWQRDVRAKGLASLARLSYHLAENKELLFEYDFINNLAAELRPITDPIVDGSIAKGQERHKTERQKIKDESGCVGMKC